MVLEHNIVTALAGFMTLGLHPGSFGHALLVGDRDLAFQRAHFIIKREIGEYAEPYGPTVVDSLFSFTQNFLPDLVIGSDLAIETWIAHSGMSGADDGTKRMVERQMNNKMTMARLRDDSVLDENWWDKCISNSLSGEH